MDIRRQGTTMKNDIYSAAHDNNEMEACQWFGGNDENMETSDE